MSFYHGTHQLRVQLPRGQAPKRPTSECTLLFPSIPVFLSLVRTPVNSYRSYPSWGFTRASSKENRPTEALEAVRLLAFRLVLNFLSAKVSPTHGPESIWLHNSDRVAVLVCVFPALQCMWAKNQSTQSSSSSKQRGGGGSGSNQQHLRQL